MASYKNLGLYFGGKSLIFVVTDDRLNSKFVRVPMNLDSSELDYVPPDNLHLIAIIQKTIREFQLEAKQISLAVPAGGTIIRAFVMPMMNANEISSAIEFEAKKYIPFNMKDLAYVFHSVPFIENKIKKLRIIFVAIRKETIDKYIQIFKGVDLDVASIESSSLSIVRVLLARKIIHKSQSAIILNIVGDACTMTFLSEGIVFFVREFQITPVGAEKGVQLDPDLIRTRLLNEVHNSMDFYNRQYGQTPVGEILILAAQHNNPYEKWLKDDLGIPSKFIDPLSLFSGSLTEQNEPGVLEALGASLASLVKVKVDFNWSPKSASRAFSSMPISFGSLNIASFMGAIKIALASLVILGIAFFLGQYFLSADRVVLEGLKSTQKKYEEMSQDDIQMKIDMVTEKVKGLRGVKLKSSITPIYFYFAQLLPENIWLTSFDVESTTRKTTGSPSADAVDNFPFVLHVEGKVYMKDANQSIRAINEFLIKLKKSKELAKYFKKFSLGDLRSESIEKNKVFSFGITGR